MAIFETDIFHPTRGFGGNGKYMSATSAQNVFNLTGRTGGGCVETGPFVPSKFKLSVGHPKGQPDCLRRDWIPWIMNYFAQQTLVDHVLAQPDYTSMARAIENIPNFSQPNIHGSGHFGVGGVLGTLGNQALSPGGMSSKFRYKKRKERKKTSLMRQILYFTFITVTLIVYSGNGSKRASQLATTRLAGPSTPSITPEPT